MKQKSPLAYWINYLLLFNVLLFFRRGYTQPAICILAIMGIAAVVDMIFQKNRRTTAIHWGITALVAALMLVWYFLLAR